MIPALVLSVLAVLQAPAAAAPPPCRVGAFEDVAFYPGKWRVTIADCTADNGLHGRLIVGTPLPLSDHLARAEAKLFKGERLVDKGIGANVLGGPLLSLAHLIELLKQHPEAPLRAGEIITTGVLTDAHPVRGGETWRTEVTGFPGLTLRFA